MRLASWEGLGLRKGGDSTTSGPDGFVLRRSKVAFQGSALEMFCRNTTLKKAFFAIIMLIPGSLPATSKQKVHHFHKQQPSHCIPSPLPANPSPEAPPLLWVLPRDPTLEGGPRSRPPAPPAGQQTGHVFTPLARPGGGHPESHLPPRSKPHCP